MLITHPLTAATSTILHMVRFTFCLVCPDFKKNNWKIQRGENFITHKANSSSYSVKLGKIKMRFAFSLFAFSLLSGMLLGIVEEPDTQEPFLLTMHR